MSEELKPSERAAADSILASVARPKLEVPGRDIAVPGRPALVEAPAPERVRMAEHLMIELEMLREFYQCWEAFHHLAKQAAIPRKSKELAAQRMTDAAHSLRAFYEPMRKKQESKPKLEVVKP